MNTQLSWLMSGLLAATLLACEKGGAPEAKPADPAPASAPAKPAEPAPAPAVEAELPVAADFRAEAEAAIPADADLNAALDALEKEIDAAE